MTGGQFNLWLEFELWHLLEGFDPEDEIFNMLIDMSDGKRYALNVWTYKSIWRAVKCSREMGDCLNGAYLQPPDLLVQRADRALLERVVSDLITSGGLRDDWLVVDDEID